ncbi:MAG: alpha/beta fold hydrolase [Bacillota bacterium]|nr:alpha/beta fold hydrolase [Bacillota bacterium]
MPMFEMPLEKLKEYKGSSPCPDDFDEYWDRALKEIRSIDPSPVVTPAAFQSEFTECNDMYYTSAGFGKVYAKYLKPKNDHGKHPVVLCFHGYFGSSYDWTSYFKWTLAGFSVLAMDCRGQGGKSPDMLTEEGPTLKSQFIRGLEGDVDKMEYRQIYLDTVQLARIAEKLPEADPERIYATGGSQGGGLTLACSALYTNIKKLAPVYPYLSDFKRVWNMDISDQAYDGLKYYFRVHDPRHEREDEIYNRLGYLDVQNLAGRIKGEVLYFTGLMDKICPPSSQFAAYNKIKSKKHMHIYPDYGHERMPDRDDLIYKFFTQD